MATKNIPIETGSDDADYYNGAFNNTRHYGWLGSHSVTSRGPWLGLRFKFPDDIDVDSVTGAYIRFKANNGANYTTYIRVEQANAPPWSDSTEGSPRERFDAIGSQDEVHWAGYASAGEVMTSPDISTRLKTAMTNMGSGDYIGIICGVDLATSAVNLLQVSSFEHITNEGPQLVIEYEAEPTYEEIAETDVNYTDGIGASSYRVCDIYVPEGIPSDPNGLPCVVWLHGGFWRAGVGGRGSLPLGFRDFILSKGYAFVNSGYKLVQSDIILGNTGPSFPDPILDMRTLANFLTEKASDYRINPNKIILTGNSAGGNVALWTVLSQGDTNNYSGYQNVNGNRSSTPGNTRPSFDLDKNIVSTPFAGVFVWVAPVDIWEITRHSDSVQAAANTLGRTGYMGEKQFTNPSSSHDELDLHKYINGTSNVYGSTTREPDVPIGYIRATGDTIVESAAGVEPLYNSLGTSGFTYDRPAVGTITTTGLTRFEIDSSHEMAMNNTTGWNYFGDWLEEVVGPSPILPAWTPRLVITP